MKTIKKQLIKLTFALAFILICIGTVSAATADENGSTISADVITGTPVESDEVIPDVSISGKVEKCSDGNPFPGVTVTVTSSGETISTTTNAAGTYSLNFKSNSTNFKVTASAPGHQTSTQEVTVVPGDEIYQGNANFKLGMDTVYVAITGSDTTGDGTQGNPYQTIGKGITEANPDGTVNVADGTYQEYLIINKNLNLVGTSQTGTIIDGTSNGRPVTIGTGAIVSISFFTIQNGRATGYDAYGGGIYNSGNLTLNNCTVKNNRANPTGSYGSSYGGGIYNSGYMTIHGSTVENNVGTGYYAYGGGINNGGTMVIGDSTIQQNTAISYSDEALGGGIYNEVMLTIINSTIQNNTAQSNYPDEARGGGIYNYGTLIMDNTNLEGNVASGYDAYGGGIYNYYGTMNISNSNINQNLAEASDTSCYGGGIYTYGGSLTLTNSNINQNRVTGQPGWDASGGGIYNTDGSVTITDSSINSNTVYGGEVRGGGISNSDYHGIMTITGCTIQDNTISSTSNNAKGGGLFNYFGATVNANFNRILNNSPTAFENGWGNVNAEYNWWGSNNPDFTALIVGDVDYNPWLYMTFQADPTSIQPGETSTLTANFNNAFDGETVTPLNPSDGHLPDGILVTFTTDLGQVGSQSVDKPTVDGVATATLTGTESGIANVSAMLDDETLTDTVEVKSDPCANVTIAKTGNGPLNVGDTGTFTITLHNNGPDAAHNVAVSDVDVPSGWTVTPSAGSWDPATSTWNVGTLNNGAGATLSISGLITTAMAETTITNTVTETQDEFTQETQSATASITVNSLVPKADLYINSWSSNNNPNVGEIYTITFKLGNRGPDTAENVVFTLPLPDGVEYVDVNVDQGTTSYDPATRTITWTLGDVVVGDPYAWVRVKALNVGSFIFRPTLTTDTDDPNLESNIQRLNVNVQAASESTETSSETVNAQTVGMQETGTPISGIALAILMVLGGFISTRKKQ